MRNVSGSICKICKAPFPGFDQLKKHWKMDHQREYVKVQTWLADVDEAIVVADCVVQAQETGVDPRENARHSRQDRF